MTRRPRSAPEAEPYISTAQAAELLGVHTSTVRAWADAGVLRVVILTKGDHRRFVRSDVLAFRDTRAAR